MRQLASLALALLLLSAGAAALPAQLARASVVQGWSGHDLLGDPRGVDVRVALAGGSHVRLELGYAQLTASAGGSGIACAGLIDPTRCPSEPLERDGRLDVVSLTVPVEVLRRGPLSLAVAPEVGIVQARGTVRGVDTGNRLESSKRLHAVGGGVALRYRLATTVPMQLHAGAQAQRLSPVRRAITVDGYTPFEDAFGLRRIEVGLAIGRPGAIR